MLRPAKCYHADQHAEKTLEYHCTDCHVMPCCAMLCHAMLCCAMLCYAMCYVLCCAMLCYAMLCYAMPCHAMPCHATPHYAMQGNAAMLRAMLGISVCKPCGRASYLNSRWTLVDMTQLTWKGRTGLLMSAACSTAFTSSTRSSSFSIRKGPAVHIIIIIIIRIINNNDNNNDYYAFQLMMS